jgi:hypothetical protein
MLNLPECYLADLPPEAEITVDLVREAWLALQRNREQTLAGMTTTTLLRDLENVASLWRDPESPFMRHALAVGPDQLGFSAATLEDGLRKLFSAITVPELEAWIEQDLGHPNRLDGFCASAAERATRRQSKAMGPETLAHVAAGNLPASAVQSLVAGLVTRSAQFLKCARGTSLVPRLFAHSVREVNAKLGACIEIAEWARDRTDLHAALLGPAECVTAAGTDETVATIRQSLPVTKRFVGYAHRLSFAYLAADSLATARMDSLVQAIAVDVCAWDQLGCLSPHVVYVEDGGDSNAETVAAALAATLENNEQETPRGIIPEEDAATIRSRRAFYEVRAAHSSNTRLWQSAGSTAWTVVYETDPQFQASCLNRFIYVKTAHNLRSVLEAADTIRGRVSTVGVAGSAGRISELAEQLAVWGITRICPVGSMQCPPLTWRHDGRPALNDLVRWTDWEGS